MNYNLHKITARKKLKSILEVGSYIEIASGASFITRDILLIIFCEFV